MIYYNFNGIRLPKPVELNGYNYQLICSNKDELFFTHSLMISKAPFKVLNDKICFDSAINYQFYTARNDSTSWREGSLTIVENDKATTTLASVIDSSDFLWTNEDIYRYNSDEIVYKKFEAKEDIVALKPKIKTNLSQDKYYRQDDENVETLEIMAESPDGGELSYQWYKNGEKIEGANFNTYKPIITEIGKNTYYCKITNNYQGDLASINSKTIVITVAEALVPISEEFLLGWKIGRLVAMLRGQQEPVIPDDPIPDTPTAAMYLYGTPSNGVSYNGTVLPDIEAMWDKGTYTKAYVTETIEGARGLRTLNGEIYHGSNGFVKANGQVQGRIYVLAHTEAAAELFEVKVGEWTLTGENTAEDGSTLELVDILWTSHDILNADGSVYLAASEPVHSGNIGLRVGDTVTYYDGAVLPELPESNLPYAVIVEHLLFGIVKDTFLYFTDTKLLYINGGTTSNGVSVNRVRYTLDKENGVWTNSTSQSGTFNLNSNVVWANYDVVDSNGTTHLSGTDPIPVGEIVDTINGVPIYEVI